MKRSILFAAVVVAAPSAALLAACGSNGVTTTPVQAPSTTSANPNAATPAQAASNGAQKAGVGSTIALSDTTRGNNIAVTLVKVVDPDSSDDGFSTPPAGDRYVSIQYRIVNSGAGTYEDDPIIDITATDAAGQTMQQDILTSTTAGAQMPSEVNLTPGDAALGFVTFDVPNGDSIAQTQYSLHLGFTGGTGQWQTTNTQAQAQASAPAQATGGGRPAPQSSATSAPQSSARQVVEDYFAAINAGNYAQAWSLGGSNIQGGSYESFIQGFAGTSSDAVTIVSTSGDTVTIALDATQTDGTHKYFAGTYTVRNGVIVAADVH
jgi:hypothetical protein